MKQKFLFTILPTNDLGLLTRSLPVAKELIDRGHEVVFSHPAAVPKKIIEEAGFDNLIPKLPLYEFAFARLTWKKCFSEEFKEDYGGPFRFGYQLIKSLPYRSASWTNEVWDTDHASALTGLLNINFVLAQVDAYIDVIKKSNATSVVDFWNPFACIACRALKIPLITINQGDALPGSNGFIWWKQKPKNVPTVVPILNKVFELYKLNTINTIEEIHVGDLTLVVGMPETDPLRSPHNYQYIGSALWQNPKDKDPIWLHNLPKGMPIIWLYSGNPNYGGRSKIFDSESMLTACFKALEQENIHVVLAMGNHKLPKSVGRVPENFRLVSFVPGLTMARHSNLMIHHGGYGSCQTGLVAGTPSLILPTFSERESNARRIALMGAGEYVTPQFNKKGSVDFDADEIRVKITEILSNPIYVENIKKWNQKLETYGGVKRAVSLIEDFIITDKQ
ncbi:MAG: nucleotide disphospho-sugar-binding domain-containing protein [Cyclobacteriaceae bacterium]